MAELSERVVSFLSAGTRTGMLGYVAADGRPRVAPGVVRRRHRAAGVQHRS
jgi:hypothetical protein